MDFIFSSIIGGILYDCFKLGIQLVTSDMVSKKLADININVYLDSECFNEFLNVINAESDLTNRIKMTTSLLNENNKYTDYLENKIYATNFAKRIDHILARINEVNAYDSRWNIEKLCEYLGYTSANTIKKYYADNNEPEFCFCREVAKKIGVMPDWLCHGALHPSEAPFIPSLGKVNEAYDVLFDDKEFREIVLVISETEVYRELLIMKRFDDIRWGIYNATFPFQSQVGASGRGKLYSLYLLMIGLQNRFSNIPSSIYFLEEQRFTDLRRGNLYPLSVKKYGRQEMTLMDDIISLNPDHPDYVISNYKDELITIKKLIIAEKERCEKADSAHYIDKTWKDVPTSIQNDFIERILLRHVPFYREAELRISNQLAIKGTYIFDENTIMIDENATFYAPI